MKSLIKNLLIFLVIAGVFYFGYTYFFKGNSQALQTNTGTTEGELVTKEFLIRLGELQTIDFGRQLFDDPRFRSLTSFSTKPETVPAGRANPFSP